MKNGNWSDDFIKKPNLQMRSVWAISPPKNGEKKFGKHPTQKPMDLLVRIIMASTDKGDVVLDPFTGSSTTGLAAILNDRKFIGIDMEKKYLGLSIKRLKELNKNKILGFVEYIVCIKLFNSKTCNSLSTFCSFI